ncbi:predicted protein [Histoplasma capsulatum var. duboisii H88]|uniref:Predicted protein n=1 Tax=Ajellomyces capsulatus (strain H88) TaxID=544711 RepID=F0UW09_AJEC8|nr:predicted protein [Histoplasma capsulatum var. duboisii H88]
MAKGNFRGSLADAEVEIILFRYTFEILRKPMVALMPTHNPSVFLKLTFKTSIFQIEDTA